MKKLLCLTLVLSLALALALPAMANPVPLTFDQATGLIISTGTFTFTGNVNTGEAPDGMVFAYKVYKADTSPNTLIDASTDTKRVSLGSTNWNYTNGRFTNTFSFTADFGQNTGTMRVIVEAWKNSVLVHSTEVYVSVLPVQLTLRQNNNLRITGDTYTFNGTVKAASNANLSFTFEVKSQDTVIDQASLARPVAITAMTYNTATKLYEGALQFTANFGSHTGPAKVILKATQGSLTVTREINVVVEAAAVTPQKGTGSFKNRGQLVKFLNKELKNRGYNGKGYKLGQSLKQCLEHFDSVLTAESLTQENVTRYLNTYFPQLELRRNK